MANICLRKMIPTEVCMQTKFSIFFEPFFYSLCFFCDIKSNLVSLTFLTIFGNVYLSSLWMGMEDTIKARLSPVVSLILLVGIILFIVACSITYIS